MIVNINNFRSKHFESSPIMAYYTTKYCCIAGYIASHVVAVRRLCWAYNIILGNCRPIYYGSKELTHQGRVTHICFSTIIRLHKKQHGGHFTTTCVNEGEWFCRNSYKIVNYYLMVWLNISFALKFWIISGSSSSAWHKISPQTLQKSVDKHTL